MDSFAPAGASRGVVAIETRVQGTKVREGCHAVPKVRHGNDLVFAPLMITLSRPARSCEKVYRAFIEMQGFPSGVCRPSGQGSSIRSIRDTRTSELETLRCNLLPLWCLHWLCPIWPLRAESPVVILTSRAGEPLQGKIGLRTGAT